MYLRVALLAILKILFILFLERGEVKEKERERNISVWLPLMHPLQRTWPAIQACVLTGNQTGVPLVHRLVLNPLSYTSQDSLHPSCLGLSVLPRLACLFPSPN